MRDCRVAPTEFSIVVHHIPAGLLLLLHGSLDTIWLLVVASIAFLLWLLLRLLMRLLMRLLLRLLLQILKLVLLRLLLLLLLLKLNLYDLALLVWRWGCRNLVLLLNSKRVIEA